MDIASWHLCHNGDCDWPLRQMSCPWACTPNPDRWDQVGPGGTGHWWITCQVSKLGAPQRLGQLSTANCSYLHYILLILHIEHRGARSCAQCFVNTSARRLEESLAQVLPLALLSYKFYTSIGAVYGSLWQFGIIFPSLEQNIPKLNGTQQSQQHSRPHKAGWGDYWKESSNLRAHDINKHQSHDIMARQIKTAKLGKGVESVEAFIICNLLHAAGSRDLSLHVFISLMAELLHGTQ